MLGEIGVRTKVAYEQLAKAHTMLCRADQDRQYDELINSFADAMYSILELQAKLGIIKHEEDVI